MSSSTSSFARKGPGMIQALLFISLGIFTISYCERRPGATSTDEAEKTTTVNTMANEILLIISDQAGADARKLAESLPTLQQASPRVRVVRADTAQIRQLTVQPGIFIVSDTMIPPAAEVLLSDGERMFAEAWLSRLPESEKKRRGEGLDWDTPGYEPPDSTE